MGERGIPLLIVAGEASGDRHAARLVSALRDRGPVEAWGVTGPELDRAGVARVADAHELAVTGFTAVVARLPRILKVERAVLDAAARRPPRAAVLVDSPGFNFRIGPRLARRGIPVFYYIAPQVWAWRPGRARAMSRWVTRLAVVFPFEEPLFRAAGVDARFVGHPLIEDLAPELDAGALRARLGIAPDARILGLLPGSRPVEWSAHLEPMLATARVLQATRRDLVALVAVAPGLDARVPDALERPGAPIRAVRGATHAIQAAATCCIVASGTATLETALFRTPLVVVYRTSALNYAIARRLVTLDRIGMPNIVAGEDVAPERIQNACTPEELAPLLAPWLDHPAERGAASARLGVVREKLGGSGASVRAAEWLAEMIA